jgi:hypothetical protein
MRDPDQRVDCRANEQQRRNERLPDISIEGRHLSVIGCFETYLQ